MDKSTSKIKDASLQSRHSKALDEIERYKLLVDSVQDYAIFLMDPEGYIQTWNKGAQRFKGYTADEIIGKHFSNFYLQRDKDARKPERELEVARAVGRVEDEDWRVRKDGTTFWANVIITALYDTEGVLVGFAKVTRDLTERKGQEDKLRDTNELLQKQQTELRALNASKDEFISLASHQLRTPATGVKQYVGMLLEGMAGELQNDQIDLLKSAYQSNERQLRIISDLLKVAQVDAGKIKFRLAKTDVSELIKNVINEQKDAYEEQSQTITFKEPAKTLFIEIDSDLIRMVLENIINNASKYSMQHTNVTVSIRETKGAISIDVADEGVGIKPEDRHKLFEKFSRIDNALSTLVGGTGLGLYWAKKIVDLHGGKITYAANADKGAIFTVRLPKAK